MLEPGERVLLLGPSGAGKSTLLAELAGQHDPSASGEREGSATVDGVDPRAARHRTGLVQQDPDAQVVMSRVGDDVAFGLENRAVPREQIWPRVDQALSTVGLRYGRDRSTAALSGGEKQRLALAGVLALHPGLLLLDEPTAQLDPLGAELVRSALADVLNATGATAVLVEHQVADALALVDRVVVLEPGGGVVADGPGERVFAEHGAALAAAGVWVPGLAVAPRQASAAPGPVRLQTTGLRSEHVPELPDVGLAAGQAVALTGPNGAGKSTFALLAAGLAVPLAGQSSMPGTRRPLHRWRARDLAAHVGTVFQDPEHSFLTRTVADELDLGPLRQGVSPAAARHRTDDLLDRLRLTRLAAANPFTLSGGQQRRLSVACALATAPSVLILDEPTFGQDAQTWQELLALLSELRNHGAALLAVTHDLPFAAALADRRLELSVVVARR